MNYRQISITAVILLLFAIIGTALVAATYEATRERIAANERATLLRKLNLLVPGDSYDNSFLDDTIEVTAPGARIPCTPQRHTGFPGDDCHGSGWLQRLYQDADRYPP